VDNGIDSWHNGDCDDEDQINAFDELIEKVKVGGWERGVSKLKEIVESLRETVPVPESIIDQIHWGDQGDEFDIHRMWAGAIDRAWSSERGGLAQGPRIVRLLVPYGGSSVCNMDKLRWVGASAVILCDILEDAGFRVEIVGLEAGKMGCGYCTNIVRLKEAGEYMSVETLTLMLCHPVAFRAIAIRHAMFSPTNWDNGSYGSPSYPASDETLREILEEMGALDTSDDSIILGEAFSEGKCRQVVAKALAQVEKLIERDEAETD
jgi:hypothetical protein